ncbi:L-type lectin-domain containing receptor kinase IV.3 [Cryptomeria japonica]|uniref:L-type lectin-domain containing receptor kinase IV.3 n=1 Tax=Cryptomeria japonica TaxID=3369 RepID=UPI0025AC25A2|nr:L-type lectin-domain containing receptor kinase IV.3 [Cryptomeria japonica]
MKWNYTKSSTALGFFGGTMGTLYQLKSCFNLLLLWLLFALHAAYSKTFSYGEFNKSSIILLKDASIHSERVLTLTNQTLRSMGRALYPTQITVKSSNNSMVSFSTSFVLSIGVPTEGLAGHGMAFIMVPNKSVVGVAGAQFLGLATSKTNGLQSNQFLAVEFDTNYNPELGDINDNHVGVNLNGVTSLESQPAAYWIDTDHFQNLSLKSGKNFQVWIDYDHVEDRLNVTIAVVGIEKPVKPLISVAKFNLSAVLKEEVYVGFSAATGSYGVENHYILGWSFSSEGKAPALDLSGLPSFSRKNPITKSKGFEAAMAVASLVLLLIAVFFAFRKLKNIKDKETIEEWELEYWPHRIPYEELKTATQGFCDEQLLGRGGFGRVYKGVLPTSGLEVAVKCITKDSTEGMKEFISEIATVGRLQHRNLVQLRGWCRRREQLFIVYDYMPNGSLDKLIFPNPKTSREILPWARRYAIMKGVATGLLYLHEQWDRRVVHRDVKSSNVLLDSDLNAKLGDFGLARLYDHAQNPQTTRVVGTVGYIAPEITITGKVTPSSDVFSFGVVLLEVACGRRPVDLSKDNEQIVLMDWVRDLYQNGSILHAADPNLNGMYDVEEMERVLKLGLLCTHPLPDKRLDIKTVLQILEGRAPLPVHQINWASDDTSHYDYGHDIVHVTDEGETDGLLASALKSVESATTSTSHIYEKDSDYDVSR